MSNARIPSVYPPPRMPVTNEGLGWDSLLKMVHNPGGDWHPAWGVVPTYTNEILRFAPNLNFPYGVMSGYLGLRNPSWEP